jgi:hypothetical protein
MLVEFDYEQFDKLVREKGREKSVDELLIDSHPNITSSEMTEVIDIYFKLYPEMAKAMLRDAINKLDKHGYNDPECPWWYQQGLYLSSVVRVQEK